MMAQDAGNGILQHPVLIILRMFQTKNVYLGFLIRFEVKSIFVCKFLSVKTMFIYAAASLLSFCLIEDNFS